MQFAGGERLHHAILGVRLQPPVQQADPVGGKHFLREMVRHLRRRLEIDLVGLLDQRIDDIGLPPGVELAADELEDLVVPRLRLRGGLDRQPPGRRVAHHRHVEIAVHRQRQRSRDRRRRHHEHVGTESLAAQRRPLQDAEPMLLVDDDESELMKAHIALHERVRADDEVDAAGFDLGQLLLPAGRGGRAGQQGDAKTRRLQAGARC